MPHYWIVGGEYTDTSFTTIAPGKAIEGPGTLASYAEAHRIWASRAWATVDATHAIGWAGAGGGCGAVDAGLRGDLGVLADTNVD